MYKQNNYKGLTFAEVASKINNKYRNRKDSITKDTMKIEFGNLANKNDAVRQASPEFKGGGAMKYQLGGIPPLTSTVTPPGLNIPNTALPNMADTSALLEAQRNQTDALNQQAIQAGLENFSANNQTMTLGDKLNVLSGGMKAAYYQQQGNRPVAEPRFNQGFDEARQQLNQVRLSTQAEQNQRIRNRNAIIRGVDQNSPNTGTRLSNLQGVYATDDMNTALISQRQQQLQNSVREKLGQLAIQQGQDRQQQLAYRDAAVAERDKFRHTGANLATDQLAELGNIKNHYKSLGDTMGILQTFPSNFNFGSDVLNAVLQFSR